MAVLHRYTGPLNYDSVQRIVSLLVQSGNFLQKDNNQWKFKPNMKLGEVTLDTNSTFTNPEQASDWIISQIMSQYGVREHGA